MCLFVIVSYSCTSDYDLFHWLSFDISVSYCYLFRTASTSRNGCQNSLHEPIQNKSLSFITHVVDEVEEPVVVYCCMLNNTSRNVEVDEHEQTMTKENHPSAVLQLLLEHVRSPVSLA